MAKRPKRTAQQHGQLGALVKKIRKSTPAAGHDVWRPSAVGDLEDAADQILGLSSGRQVDGLQEARTPEQELCASDFLDQVSDDPMATARYARNRRTKKPSWRLAM